ncbi:glycine-rich domain-containing protein [Methylobacterium radiotolerans]
MPDLWARILHWHDRLASDGAFTTRVRTALAVDGHAVSEAILEYLRFAYLAWTSPVGSTPSRAVDEVWHAHLLFTRSYETFCQETRGHLLHHEPGDGETDEARFREAYLATLDRYRAEFGEPPIRWWPCPQPAETPPATAVCNANFPSGFALLLPGAVLSALAWRYVGPEVGLASAFGVVLVAAMLVLGSSAPAGTGRKRDRGGGSCDGGGGAVVAAAGDPCSDGGAGGGDGCGGSSCGSGCGGGGCGGA